MQHFSKIFQNAQLWANWWENLSTWFEGPHYKISHSSQLVTALEIIPRPRHRVSVIYVMSECVCCWRFQHITHSDSAPCCLTWTYASTFAETTNTCHWRSRLKNPSGRLNLDCWECGCKSDKQCAGIEVFIYLFLLDYGKFGLFELENFTGNRKFSFWSFGSDLLLGTLKSVQLNRQRGLIYESQMSPAKRRKNTRTQIQIHTPVLLLDDDEDQRPDLSQQIHDTRAFTQTFTNFRFEFDTTWARENGIIIIIISGLRSRTVTFKCPQKEKEMLFFRVQSLPFI